MQSRYRDKRGIPDPMAEIITTNNPREIAVGDAVAVKNLADSPIMTVLAVLEPEGQAHRGKPAPTLATCGYFDSRTPQILQVQCDIKALEPHVATA